MARDKLITIRIEGEKRKAFGELAKSQNTDTASLLYDFINQCLSGKIDIGIVTGKKQWIDKLDNQLDSDRIDKLEANTQEIDNRLDTISKKLTDWIEAFDDRLNDCDQGLSNKMISLEHRLNALAMQLDSQQDSQQIDSIDTDSQKDSQQIDDMKPLLKREREASIAAPIPTGETSHDEPVQPAIASIDGTVETVEPISTIETVASAIETVQSEPNSIDTEPGKGEIPKTHKAIAARLGLKSQTKLNYWISTGKIPSEYADRCRFNESKTKILWI